jgi:NADP-reducing hydrogenase subunit HndD
MKEIKFSIDGKPVVSKEGMTILQAARENGIDIPTLCYLKDINEIGACRMCLVEIEGKRALQASCVYPVEEGINVITNNARIRKARKINLELILSNHNRECLTCIRSENCELQKLSYDLGVKEINYIGETTPPSAIDRMSTSIVRDDSKCVLCRRCVNVCKNVQGVAVLGETNRGFATKVEPVFNKSIAEVGCINCGQCIINCPVGALRVKNDIDKVWDAIADESKYVVVQTAPAVRAAIGEAFGLPMGTPVTGKMVAALKRFGFDKVFDTDFGADVTIMEEGTELLERIQNGGVLPLFTSCSPGWIKFIETYYPDLLPHVSSCKSPQQMTGALLKSHYAKMNGIDPKDMVVVSVMPCTAKKYELSREEMVDKNGYQDTDISITTRECAKMIKQAGIFFNELEDEKFDDYYGDSTGAAAIFGATGGVMEAAVRTVADILNDKDIQEIDYTTVRGIQSVKEAVIEVTDDLSVKVAVVHGGANIKATLERIAKGEMDDFHFIEFMACPGGCVNGGGQPIVSAKEKLDKDIRVERAKALYTEDAENMTYRKSHQNPSVIKIYEEFLEKPCGHKSHELLHTTYSQKPKLIK